MGGGCYGCQFTDTFETFAIENLLKGCQLRLLYHALSLFVRRFGIAKFHVSAVAKQPLGPNDRVSRRPLLLDLGKFLNLGWRQRPERVVKETMFLDQMAQSRPYLDANILFERLWINSI